MQIGLKEKKAELKSIMSEDEMELYLLQNEFDLGEGLCEKGKEHLYLVDSTKTIEFGMGLGYQYSPENFIFEK